MNFTEKDLWTAIWYGDNTTGKKVSEFLRTFLPRPAKRSSKGAHKLAVIVGHNKKAKGAYAEQPVGKSEFQFNSLVAEIMRKTANSDPELEIAVFKRLPISSYSAQIDEVYSRVNKWEPELAMELHFDWQAGAGVVLMIHYPGSSDGNRYAKMLSRNISEIMQTDRASVIVRAKNARGGRSLWACKCPIVMTEPFDCSNIEHREKVAELGEKAFADAYLRSAKEYFNQ